MSRALLDQVLQRFPNAIVSSHAQCGDETALIRRESLHTILQFLRDTCAINMLTDLTCVDYLGSEERFELVYHLYSIESKQRLRIKTRIPEQDCSAQTVTDLWKTANWLEREVWDFYGVKFIDHPDLRRILLYEEFVGHPLRKDYPIDKHQPLVRRADAPKMIRFSNSN